MDEVDVAASSAPTLDPTRVQAWQQEIHDLKSSLRELQIVGRVDQVKPRTAAAAACQRDSSVEGSTPASGARQGETLASDHVGRSTGYEMELELPKFDGSSEAWYTWRSEFLFIASICGFDEALHSTVPVPSSRESRNALLAAGVDEREIYAAEKCILALLSSIEDQTTRSLVAGAGSPSEAWQTLNDWFDPDTFGRDLDLFNDLVEAQMPDGSNPMTFYSRLASITFKMSTHVKDSGVVKYIRGKLLHMKFLTSLPRSYDVEVQELRIEFSKGTLDSTLVRRVVQDRYMALEREKMKGKGRHHGDQDHVTKRGSGQGGRRGKRSGDRGRHKSRKGRSMPSPSGAISSTSQPTSTSTGNMGLSSGPRAPSKQSSKACLICLKGSHREDVCPRRTCVPCGGISHGRQVCPSAAAARFEEEGSDSDFALLAFDEPAHAEPGPL